MPNTRPIALKDYLALVGDDLEPSAWTMLDQAAIDAFAEATGDRQFIHVDPARAAATPLGGTIAHAFLTLSLLGGWVVERMPPVEGVTMGLNYGFERVRFMAPVRSGRRVRGLFRIAAIERRRDDQILTTLAVTVQIEGEPKPALVADWLVLMML